MIELHLPAVQLDERLDAVLRRMRWMNVSGAICLASRPWLFFVRDVVLTIRRQTTATVGDIETRVLLSDSTEIQVIGRMGATAVDPHIGNLRIGTVLREVELVQWPTESLVVRIDSRELERALTSSPRDCFCSKSGERVRGGKDGDPCPNKDGGIVRCA
jgi:hypothetical protein